MFFVGARGSFGFPRNRFGAYCVLPWWHSGGMAVRFACLWVISGSWDSFISRDWLSGLLLSGIALAFLFFPRLASPCFFWCRIGFDCIALSPLFVSSLLLYCLASSCLALIGLALPCLLWLDVVLKVLHFSGFVLPCLAVTCLDILISVALFYFSTPITFSSTLWSRRFK